MRNPGKKLSILAAVFVLLGARSVMAQERSLNRVVDGDFENGVVSLSRPAGSPFPVFWGGWASRGHRVPDIIEGAAFEGIRSVRLATRPQDPLQIIQDLPINSPAFALRLAFLIEEGNQRVRLFGGWDRGEPSDGEALFEARLSTTGIALTTPAGTWQISGDISPYQWHTLTVIADPRLGTHSVWLDGHSVMSLPGVSARPPSTIVIGGDTGDSGSFRYDAIEVLSLVDLEMTTIRDAVTMLVHPAQTAVLERLAAATAALNRRAPTLALPELGVARSLLGATSPGTADVRRAIAELIELIEISGAPGEDREMAQYF